MLAKKNESALHMKTVYGFFLGVSSAAISQWNCLFRLPKPISML